MSGHLSVLHNLADGGVWFATVSIVYFLMVYTRGLTDWRWAHNVVGRTIIALDLCLLLILVPECIQKVVGRIAFFDSVTWQYVVVADIYVVGLIAAARGLSWMREWHLGDPMEDLTDSVGVPENADPVEH